jgi:SEC-C motif
MRRPVRQHGHARFPSREERERIIQRRAQLMRALIDALVTRDTDPQLSDAQIGTLVADYGATEVERMLDRITRQFQHPRDPDAQEAWLYAEYVAFHRRFGDTRPLLTAQELEGLRTERATLLLRRDFLGEPLSVTEQHRFAEIGDLILADSDLWDDLVPEHPPPAQRPMAPPRRPGRNEPCWCGSERKYKHYHLRTDEAH